MGGERKTGNTFVRRICDYNERFFPQVFQLSRCPHSMPRVDLYLLSMPQVDLSPRSMPRVDLCPLSMPRVDLCLPLVHQTFSMDHKVRGQMENFNIVF